MKFFGLESEAVGNQKAIENLNNGECLFQDLYGRMGIIYLGMLRMAGCFRHLTQDRQSRRQKGSVTG